jgi:Carboxypeptidase regulatory-like domain
VTNSDGYFTFASVPLRTYILTVEAKGFQTYKAEGIALNGADKRNFNISLAVGTASQTVEVNAQETPLVTTDSAEKSFTLESTQLQNLTQVGSNTPEYIRIMPGFGIQNGTNNKANYTGEVIGINANGDAGSQSPLNNAWTYTGCRATRWISPRTALTCPIRVAIATHQSTPTRISFRSSRC